MKKYSLFIFLLLILCMQATVFAAEIQENQPFYDGQFMLRYKPASAHIISSGKEVFYDDITAAGYEDSQPISTPIDFSFDWNEEKEIPKNTSSVITIGEKTIYQVEPDRKKLDFSKNNTCLLSSQATSFSYSKIGETRSFSVYDYTNDEKVSDSFTCFYISDLCEVFVQNSLDYGTDSDAVKTNIATKVGSVFNTSIQPYLTSYLAGYTGYYGDLNGKIIILIENIKDNYETTNAYNAGYYLLGSAYKGILHIDTYPLMNNTSPSTAPNDEEIEKSYATISHEFTHMIEKEITNNSPHWFSEFLAISTEASLYPERTAKIQYRNFLLNPGYIRTGAVLNYTNYDENLNIISANYALTYLFQNYLRGLTADKNGNTEIFHDILEAAKNNPSKTFEEVTVLALNGILSENNSEFSFTDFDDLVKSFYIAFTLQEDFGKYKFCGINDISKLTTPYSPDLKTTGKSGSCVIYPYSRNTFYDPDDIYDYISFSYSENPSVYSVDFLDKNHTIVKSSNGSYILTEAYFSLNGNVNRTLSNGSLSANNECYDLVKGTFFMPDTTLIYPLRNGSLIFYSPIKNFNLYCTSLDDSSISDSVYYRFDNDGTFAMNSFSSYPSFNNNTFNHYIQIISNKERSIAVLYYAIYDAATNILINSEKKLLSNFTPNTLYRINTPAVEFADTDSGKYYVKMYIVSDEISLSPIALPFEYEFTKTSITASQNAQDME